MCEFCHQHGEDKKWYLKAQNYSEDLLSDIKRRSIIKKFALGAGMLKKKVLVLDVLSKVPGLIKYVLAHGITGRMKKVHFGQVVPIEDVERIFDIVNSIWLELYPK